MESVHYCYPVLTRIRITPQISVTTRYQFSKYILVCPVVSKFVYGAEDRDQIDAMLIGSCYKFKKSVLLSKCESTYNNHGDLQTAVIHTKKPKNSTLLWKKKKKNIPPGCNLRYIKKHKRLIQSWKNP